MHLVYLRYSYCYTQYILCERFVLCAAAFENPSRQRVGFLSGDNDRAEPTREGDRAFQADAPVDQG